MVSLDSERVHPRSIRLAARRAGQDHLLDRRLLADRRSIENERVAMIVRVHSDVHLKVVDDPEHDQKWKNHFIYWPNSVRRDVPMYFTLTNETPERKPIVKETPHAA